MYFSPHCNRELSVSGRGARLSPLKSHYYYSVSIIRQRVCIAPDM